MSLARPAPLLAVILFAAGCAGSPNAGSPASPMESASTSIEAVVRAQAEAWNRGDIENFMQGYWPSPELRFASGGTVTRGFEQTLDRYETRYASREAMGKLSFSELETVQLSEDAAVLHGRWQLQRTSDAPSGLLTLVFRKMDGEWQIISDTTTSAD
ncbi:YybH family protein [Henriciella marina]|uniref:YybH family protein n=1 Tax=Henriciella marina TaxID=453851 RepID=UPI0003806108|nr:nuclear transport factor 2 family protein [Henriciella marina]